MASALLGESGTSGASTRRVRGWSLVPISVAVHLAALVALFVIPLTAEVAPPVPGPPLANVRWVTAAAPPSAPRPAPPANDPSTVRTPAWVPVAAPATIEPERPVASALDSPPGAVGDPGSAVEAGIAVAFGEAVPPPAPPEAPPLRGPRRVGEGIREPRRIVDVAPAYPAIARAARIEGIVILEAIIDERGNVDRIRVVRSAPLLDQAAIDAVGRWRYTPTLLNGVPVQVLMTITLNFRLQE